MSSGGDPGRGRGRGRGRGSRRGKGRRSHGNQKGTSTCTPGREADKSELQPFSNDLPRPGNTGLHIPVVPKSPQERLKEGIVSGPANDGKSGMGRSTAPPHGPPCPLREDLSQPGNTNTRVAPTLKRDEEGIIRDPVQGGKSTLTRGGGDARMFPSPLVASAPYGQPRLITSSPKSFVKPVKKGPSNHYGKKQPPDRPGHGSEGREIVVRSNYFPLRLPRHITIHHYDVATVPVKLPKSVSRLVSTNFVLIVGI